MSGPGHQGNLPRLPPEKHRGHAVVHWNHTLEKPASGWLNEHFHLRFREWLLHAGVRENVWCPIYCLMPDHLHLVWMGMRRESDQLLANRFLRTGLNQLLAPHQLQHQAYDRVLREEERHRNAFAAACFYDLANPLRAGLVTEAKAWPFHGCMVPGYPDMHPLDDDFWSLFWRLWVQCREAEDGGPVTRAQPLEP